LRRGDVVLVRGGAGPAGKLRPCVVIQRTSTLDDAPKITLCPLTSAIRVASSVRPLLQPSPDNGLTEISQVEIDWIYTYRADRIERTVGSIADADMLQIDQALRRWLDL
jgi:mRNA interferase MazF